MVAHCNFITYNQKENLTDLVISMENRGQNVNKCRKNWATFVSANRTVAVLGTKRPQNLMKRLNKFVQ